MRDCIFGNAPDEVPILYHGLTSLVILRYWPWNEAMQTRAFCNTWTINIPLIIGVCLFVIYTCFCWAALLSIVLWPNGASLQGVTLPCTCQYNILGATPAQWHYCLSFGLSSQRAVNDFLIPISINLGSVKMRRIDSFGVCNNSSGWN